MMKQQSHLEQHIVVVVVDEERCELVLRRMRLLIVIAAMGGFLSGYNTGVLSGVLLPLTHVRLWTCGRTKRKSLYHPPSSLPFFLASICGGKLNHTPLGVDLQSWGLLQSFVSVLLFCFWHKIIKC
jgi:hypothetical protein